MSFHILVTGSSGFIGRHLCYALKEFGYRISCLDRSNILGHDRYLINLLDAKAVGELIGELQPDFVVHLAANKTRSFDKESFRSTYDSNVHSAWNVIDACIGLPNFRRFIFFGSCEEYGLTAVPYFESQKAEPLSPYGLSKLTITQILGALFKSRGFRSLVLRPSIVYGPGQEEGMFIPSLIQALFNGNPYAMTKGEQLRDFIYVDDVVRGVLKAIQADEDIDGNVINIASGVSFRIKDVVDIVLEEMPKSTVNFVNLGAIPYRELEQMQYAVSAAHAQEILGWQANTGLRDGLRKTINWVVGRDGYI